MWVFLSSLNQKGSIILQQRSFPITPHFPPGLTLALSDHPNDWIVTSRRLISILRRHSYSDDRAVFMFCSFSCRKRKNIYVYF